MFNNIKEILGSYFKIVAFLLFTIIWTIFIYLIDGEWLYFIPIIVADVLFFETISWQFWKKKKKKKKKNKSEIRSWLDAILFAIVAATLLRTFLIEAYTIPTSSMEKSMLIGDFLFVSKVAYGPRVPMTPLAVPLVHHTIPGTKKKSYSERIQLPYHRMKGIKEIQRNDCVVFNWPAEKLGRPIDKKENYVKRCVGLPGDTIEFIKSKLIVNNSPQEEVKGMKRQWHHTVKTTGSSLNPEILYKKYDITEGGYGRDKNEYILTLTDQNKEALQKMQSIKSIKRNTEETGVYADYIFPYNEGYAWNTDNYGPIIIPKKGSNVSINTNNLYLYKDVIERYEGNSIKIINDTIYINNKITNSYTFKMNYYFMVGDNRHNSADSRFWGFVPEDHIVGKALFIWMSWDKNAKGLNKIRWERLFTRVR